MHGTDWGQVAIVELTIASGASLSDAADIGAAASIAIETPGTMTGAGFEFVASRTKDGTYLDVYNEGTQVEIASAASRFIALAGDEATAVLSARWLKVRSTDGAGTPAVEGAERTIWLHLKY